MPYKDFTVGEILTSSDVDSFLMSQVIIRCTSATRPGAAVEGWHIYETDTNRFLVYNGSAWVGEGVERTYVIKTSDQSTTSTTFLNDSQLTLPLAANTNYWFDCFVGVTGTTTGNQLSLKWVVPSGATMVWLGAQVIGASVEGSIHMKREVETNLIVAYVDATGAIVPMRGLVRCGATAGSLQMQFASQVGNSVTIKTNSLFQLYRL